MEVIPFSMPLLQLEAAVEMVQQPLKQDSQVARVVDLLGITILLDQATFPQLPLPKETMAVKDRLAAQVTMVLAAAAVQVPLVLMETPLRVVRVVRVQHLLLPDLL